MISLERGEGMGYILPVDNYQYNDYQRRVTKEKVNKHFIERPFKVILEREHQEISTKYATLNRIPNQRSKPQASSEELFALLTGKGTLFHDLV